MRESGPFRGPNTGEGINCWRYVDAHSQTGAETMLQSVLPIPAANMLVMHNRKAITVQLPYIHDTNRWYSVDTHFDILCIQHQLQSLIGFFMIWTCWLCFGKIETQPFGKAKHSNIPALFTLKLPKFVYLAERFIAPSIHLCMNRYSQATANHSPKIYL